MLAPDYEKLMFPYSKDGCTVELLVNWMREKSGCSPEVVSLAVRNLFTEIAQGRGFSTDGCDCGCKMTNAHTAMNHYAMKMAKDLQAIANREYWKVLEKVDCERIARHIKIMDKKYMKKKLTSWQDKIFAPWLAKLLKRRK